MMSITYPIKFKVAKIVIATAVTLTAMLPAGPHALAAKQQAAEQTDVSNKQADAKLVPLRPIAETFGAKLEWDNPTQKATIVLGTVTIVVQIGQSTASINGQSVQLGAEIVGGNTVVPLNFINKALSINADWDSSTQQVVIAADDYIGQASSFIYALQQGQYTQALKQHFNETLQSLMNSQLLQDIWTNQAAGLKLQHQLSARVEKTSVHTSALLSYQTATAPLEVAIRFDQEGKIDDFYISPLLLPGTYEKPSYDNPKLYVEKEVTLNENGLALPATLTMPVGKGPFPAVVLVPGSGPGDRDQTTGAIKPFRDLAVGLAAHNIAVLRYEKVTLQHPYKAVLQAPLTVKEETIDDALRAAKLLKETEGIDADRIYLIGLSQGGMLAPMIIDADKTNTIAGAVIMAAASKPFEDGILDQVRSSLEQAQKSEQPTAPIEQRLAFYEQQFKLLKDPQYSAANLPPRFALPDPYWWFSIRNYYGGEVAKTQSLPLFILQGDNDFIVHKDNLDGWKKALVGRKNVEFKLYPKMTHLMTEYEQLSTGYEFSIPANIPTYLIDDIASWIGKQKR
jgi:uncharacterized protein